MPPCTCGLRVERHQVKLICIICKQLFHPECCNILDADIDFVKKSYKCQKCLSARRISLSLSPIDVTAPLLLSDADNANGVGVACIEPTHAATDIASVTCDNADNADIADNTELVAADNLATSPAPIANDNVTLQLILAEVLLLKKSNEDLRDVVSALKNENAALVAKMDDMHTKILHLTSSLSSVNTNVAELSPKRKKQNTRKANTDSSDVIIIPQADSVMTLPTNASVATTSHKPATYASVVRPQFVDANAHVNANVVTAGSADFQEVRAKKKKKIAIVFGKNDSNELGVISRKKWLHLSSFNSSVKADDLTAFVSKYSGLAKSDIACYPLIKKDADVDSLKFINFKLGVSEAAFEKVFNADFWPANIRVRMFNFLNKSEVPGQIP